MSRLTEAQKESIRQLYGTGRKRGENAAAGEWTQVELAVVFGCSIPTVRKAIKEGASVAAATDAPSEPTPTPPEGFVLEEH